MIGIPVKVSVIVPVYNVEKYLGSCLSSCINQTLYDIEIICVNDGSTDNSPQILQVFAEKDHRIKIINKKNGGLSSARNEGIRNACGSIIMFLDSDDYLSVNACERVWKETLEAPTDVVIFGTAIFPDLPRASDWYYNTLHIRSHRHWKFSPCVLFDEPGAKPFVWRQAYSRSFFEKTGLLFDERVSYGEDMVFQMEAFPHCNNFSFISDPLYHYRWTREGSLMHTYNLNTDSKTRQHLHFCEYIAAYWKEQGWLDQYGVEFTQWLIEFIGYNILEPEAQNRKEYAQSLNDLMKKYGLDQHLNQIKQPARRHAQRIWKHLN